MIRYYSKTLFYNKNVTVEIVHLYDKSYKNNNFPNCPLESVLKFYTNIHNCRFFLSLVTNVIQINCYRNLRFKYTPKIGTDFQR